MIRVLDLLLVQQSALWIMIHLLIFNNSATLVTSSWDGWWTYDGISGVEFWGLLNPKWSHCNKGRRQSPVDINPDLLLYDPSLTAIHVNGDQMTGQLVNTGRGLRFKIVPPSSSSSSSSSSLSPQAASVLSIPNPHDPLGLKKASLPVNTFSSSSSSFSSSMPHSSHSNSSISISGGPLSYEYTLHDILFHYGRSDDRGSEHTINETSFPAEVQLYLYNSQLYNSWEESVNQPNGLAGIAVLVQLAKVATLGNPQLKHLFHNIETVKHKGASSKVHKLSLSHLIPAMTQYMTYEGSLTQPSCVETVQWIILNRPIYMTSSELSVIRNTILLEGQGEGNFRPTQSMNSRSLRTNIWNGRESSSSTKTYQPSSSVSPFQKVTISGSGDVAEKKRVSNLGNNSSKNRMKFCTSAGFIGYRG